VQRIENKGLCVAQRYYFANNDYLALDKRKIIGYSRVSALDPSRPPEGSENWLTAMKQHLQRPKGLRRSEFREQSENVYENKQSRSWEVEELRSCEANSGVRVGCRRFVTSQPSTVDYST